MAALRHAARRLSKHALLQRGPPPGRRLMSISSISGKSTSSARLRGEMEREFKKKKEELFDLLIEVKMAELYPQLSWKDIQIHRLITQLAAQMEPRPHEPNWRRFRGTRRLNGFTSIYTTLGFYPLLYYFVVSSDKKEDGATSNNCQANIVSAPRNDTN